MLKLVPFNNSWITNDKIDVHAIYERPRYRQDEYGEWSREYDADGLPTWDITSPLPVKQHNKYMAKGFRYITLADRMSLHVAARNGTLPAGTTARDFDQHQTGGPWNYRRYRESADVKRTEELAGIRSDVERFGPDVAEEIRRRSDPEFILPAMFREAKPAKREKGAA